MYKKWVIPPSIIAFDYVIVITPPLISPFQSVCVCVCVCVCECVCAFGQILAQDVLIIAFIRKVVCSHEITLGRFFIAEVGGD